MRTQESRSRLRTALQLACIATLVTVALALLPDNRNVEFQAERPPEGASKLHEFSTFAPSKLEADYREAWRLVRDNHTDTNKLVALQSWEHKFDGTIFTQTELKNRVSEMLASLQDKRTTLLSEAELTAFDKKLEAETKGVGMSFNKEGVISEVLPGSPAEKAGLKVGDIVITLDGSPLSKLKDQDLAVDNKGARLSVKRKGTFTTTPFVPPSTQYETWEVSLTPASFRRMELVTFALDERMGTAHRVGYIRVNNLRCSETIVEVSQYLKKMEEAKALVAVLDLSGLKGGGISYGAQLAALFVEDGPIVHSYRREEGGEPYLATYTASGGNLQLTTTPFKRAVELIPLPEGRWLDKPLFVLIDEQTEGTAELVAVALQGNKRAKLVGKTSAGKHCGQRIFALRSGLLIQVTTCRNCGPDGKLITSAGVAPDVKVEATANPYKEALKLAFGITGGSPPP